MSGIVLACAPAVIGLLIWVMNPKYMEPLFKTMIGQASLGAAVIFAILGYLIIKQITTIKI
jgi:tight adherence protein B